MNNDNDNLRKLPTLFRSNVSGLFYANKEAAGDCVQVCAACRKEINTPVPLDREAMGKALYSVLVNNSICQNIEWENCNRIYKGAIRDAAAQFSALLPRDGGVCEWRFSDVRTQFESGCNKYLFAGRTKVLEHFTHCPFCGKTIKEVK